VASDSPLLILGASVRAAAFSAARAGFAPIGLDLFADRDLTERFRAVRVERDDYPGRLSSLAHLEPAAPWIYTGALENSPTTVDRIACDRPLLGIAGPALRALRHPPDWTNVLRRAGLDTLDVRVAGDPMPTGGTWLDKPLASAGGRGMRLHSAGHATIPRTRYLQRYVSGRSFGACFLGIGRSSRLVGITRQLLGRSSEGLRTAYRGSVGPCPAAADAVRTIRRIGEALVAEFGLRGLFEVDLIVNGSTAWPVEINPRYSASVEVLEEALGINLLAEHARSFGLETRETESTRGCGSVAKLILFARREARAPDDWPWPDLGEEWPIVADLPAAGTILRPGDPVLTVFGRGSTIRDSLGQLRMNATTWQQRIDGWRAP
jgi:uncharacterized protein